ncbi:hypothetical protein BDV35DRAFT_398214 [Aspergillus flavus]|uniref:Uncharacterized protein n=3 Tax=Aspergillus subgen. Circumdati TaxID=2720871 RepID=A0A1S9DI34_ASPOZ|nr:hypothetical protein BDV35DRAFT_398214 [Aspergillus flavus]OOO08596.1 hypothetical protein OAory_01098920 [Aspergillus oryzae]KAJ1710819.1 hypothetical protein NYO67_7055 [Aspergillus flavus]QMW45835.1 hypothetical protein G4B11_009290 [Aspergillus flavus]RAQ55668.1 hypothetical protein AFGD_011694 [Aspergillus flavus]
MPTLSGYYTSLSGRTLTINERDELTLLPRGKELNDQTKLRADGEFWLCRDDGRVGKFGNPTKAIFHINGQGYHIWVEPRGFSNGMTEYGLVPILPQHEYSNTFLAVNDLDQLDIVGQWGAEAKFRCFE